MAAPRASAISISVRALAAAIALALAMTSFRAGAQTRVDPFTVRDVTVDATATGATAPRDAALAEAQRRALQRLYARLIPADQLARAPRLGARDLADLVDAVEVQSERIVGPRWIGAFAIGFRAVAVRELLANAGVSFAETGARPLVVVPVYVTESGPPRLWEPHPWRVAWQNLAPGDALQPWIVARGDDADRADFPPTAIESVDARRLTAFARRYGAGAVAVATARRTAEAVTVSVLRYAPGAGEETVVETVSARPGEGEEALLQRAAALAAHGIEERWKQSVLVVGGQESRLAAQVPLKNLADWVAVRARLAELPMVRRVVLTSLSKERALIEVEYVGEETALRAAMGERALTLARDDSGGEAPWRVGLAGAGP